MKKVILIALCGLSVSLAACQREAPLEQVQEVQQEQLLSKEDYIESALKEEEAKMNEAITSNADSEILSKEMLQENINLSYLIYSARSIESNARFPIIVSDYTQENKDILWQAYIIPSELDNYAVTLNNDGENEYIIAILKPNENYKLKVYDSIKLLRSGYLGGFSNSHTLKVPSAYIKKVNDYIVICLCEDAETIGQFLTTSLEEQLKLENMGGDAA